MKKPITLWNDTLCTIVSLINDSTRSPIKKNTQYWIRMNKVVSYEKLRVDKDKTSWENQIQDKKEKLDSTTNSE